MPQSTGKIEFCVFVLSVSITVLQQELRASLTTTNDKQSSCSLSVLVAELVQLWQTVTALSAEEQEFAVAATLLATGMMLVAEMVAALAADAETVEEATVTGGV